MGGGHVVKVEIGRQSQVADGYLGWAQMSNEAVGHLRLAAI